MTEELISKLKQLKFSPYGHEAMKVCVDDVEYVAVVHPLRELVFIVTHTGERSATQFEACCPIDSSIQEIAKAMSQAYEQIHPDKNKFGDNMFRSGIM